MVEIGARPHTSECTKSKGVEEIKSLLLKGKALCFPNWHSTQSKDSDSIDLNWPLVAKEWIREIDAYPKWECHKLRVIDGDREGVAAYTVGGRWRDESSNKCPILRVVPISYPVYGSYTSQLRLEKRSSKPGSQSWPTNKRFNEILGTKYVLDIDSWWVEIDPMWLTSKWEPLAV